MTNMNKPPISSATRLFLLSFILIGTCSALQRQSVHRKPALSFSPQPWGVVQSSSTDDDPTNDDHVILLDLHDAATTSVLQKDDSSSLQLASDKQEQQQQSKGPQIVLMGAPSSGKGTQSERIVQQYNVVHLSTGDMLRQAVQQQQQQQDSSANNNIGAIAKAYMDRGELVPDDIMTQLVLHRISQPDCIEKGWILDGFPRTRGQAEAMKEFGIVPDKIILLEVPDALLLERVVGRRLDPVTGKIYHLTFFPPSSHSIRDRLVQRSDDTVESMVNRLRSFHANVDAIREFYDNEVLVKVNGSGTPDEIAKSVFGAIDKRRRQVLATTK